MARVVGRRRLLGEQMAEYGRGSLKYSIWGQVVMGYVKLHNEKHALTFQVVETETAEYVHSSSGHRFFWMLWPTAKLTAS